jgi:hypothetical protein
VSDGKFGLFVRADESMKEREAGGDDQPPTVRAWSVIDAERSACVEVQCVRVEEQPAATPISIHCCDVVARESGDFDLG